eukprot:350799-Rhodomonas_salina.1
MFRFKCGVPRHAHQCKAHSQPRTHALAHSLTHKSALLFRTPRPALTALGGGRSSKRSRSLKSRTTSSALSGLRPSSSASDASSSASRLSRTSSPARAPPSRAIWR